MIEWQEIHTNFHHLMKNSIKGAAAACIAAAILCSASGAFADGLASRGKSRVPQGFSDVVHDVVEEFRQTALQYRFLISRHFPKAKEETRRVQAARVWSRQVIRGKQKFAREHMRKVSTVMQRREDDARKIPSRERMVQRAMAHLSGMCSTLHNHDRARCLAELAFTQESVPAIVAATRGLVHAAAHAQTRKGP